MAFKIMADNQVEISAKQDGALYNVACGGQDFIIQGLGDEFALTRSGRTITVGTGEAVVHGRHITADGTNSIALPTNSTGYLVLRVDLTQPIGQEASLYTTPTLTNQEINWGGTTYDFPLATFTTTSTSVSNFEDVRRVVNATSNIKFKIGTDVQKNASSVIFNVQGDSLYINLEE